MSLQYTITCSVSYYKAQPATDLKIIIDYGGTCTTQNDCITETDHDLMMVNTIHNTTETLPINSNFTVRELQHY